MAGIYADEGLSGTNTKKREQFLKMIEDCKARKVDMIITKSISRFARNTLDCLNYVRLLKDLGIGVIFEKENINTLDSKGEVLLSILSSLAQDESRSISENSTWGIRRSFEQGKLHVNHTKFLGYDKDSDGNLIIDAKQAIIVHRIYNEYMEGKDAVRIAKDLEKDKVPKWDGTYKWYESSIRLILGTEKYKGDALLQKTYTVDYLNKKRVVNNGEVPQYYVENSHPGISDEDTWEAVQLEMKRRKEYRMEHGINKVEHSLDKSILSGKVICGKCGKAYGRKMWYAKETQHKRYIWQCSDRYPKKGVKGCDSRHIDDGKLYLAFFDAMNQVVENKGLYMERWQRMVQGEDVLKRVAAKRFIELFDGMGRIEAFDPELFSRTVEKLTINGFKKVTVYLLDGTEIECEIE